MLRFVVHPDAPEGFHISPERVVVKFVAWTADAIPRISLVDDESQHGALVDVAGGGIHIAIENARRPSRWPVFWDELAGGRFDILYAREGA